MHRTLFVQVKKATKTVILNCADIEISSAKCGNKGIVFIETICAYFDEQKVDIGS